MLHNKIRVFNVRKKYLINFDKCLFKRYSFIYFKYQVKNIYFKYQIKDISKITICYNIKYNIKLRSFKSVQTAAGYTLTIFMLFMRYVNIYSLLFTY